ncbi:MAG: MFS transporter [Polyangiaceae bacterium]
MSAEPDKKGSAVAFGATWLAYATYYLGRKGLSVSKARVVRELGIGEGTLAAIDTGYLGAYAIGQFVSGLIGDRIGARRLVSIGMLFAAITCAAFGAATTGTMMLVAFTLNGFAQSTGWPGTTKGMAEWTPPERRGAVMGLWCTSYQIGGIVATWFCTLMLGHYGWRSAFFGPAIAIAIVGGIVFLTLRPGPYAVKVMPATGSIPARIGLDREVFKNRLLWCYGFAYFFIKLIRYSVLFWLPYYLHTALGLNESAAGYLSISFEVGGVVGAVSIGFLSDKVPHLSRSVIAAIGLVGLAGALLAYAWIAPSSPVLQFSMMALIGGLLFGPDSLVSASAAQDAGGQSAAARATGFVNGVGSVGALLQGYVTVGIRKSFGWSAVFYVFVAFALLSALALAPTFRKKTASPA